MDTLEFKGVATYADRLKSYQEATGLNDAVTTGTAKLHGHPIGLAVMDFNFLAATMGSVVGEKITRTIELSTRKKWTVVIVCASGGARMYEGMLSLMQMAKTSGALAIAQRGRTSLPGCAHQSHHGRRHGQLCFPGRHHHCRAEEYDRIRGSARYQRNDPSGFARRISDGGISREARPDRRGHTAFKIADGGWSASRLSVALTEVIYEESLAWLYATQQFGIKLGLENIRGLLEALGNPQEHLSFLHVARYEWQGLGLRDLGCDPSSL